MQLEALKIFCDVARFRSFSDAARSNHVTQSSASQTVHALEERMGTPLIDRSHRPWRLTHAGETFYHGCRDLLHRFEALESKVKGIPLAQQAEVRVASIYSVGLRLMKLYAQTFEAEHAPARVHLEYHHPEKVYEAVASGAADVGIISFPRSHKDLTVLPWRREEMVVVLPPDHRLVGSESVNPRALEGEKFVAFDRGLGIRTEVDRFLKKNDVTVDVTMEFDNIEAIKRAVEIGSGISLLPAPTLDREVHAGTLASAPLRSASFARPLGILRRRGPVTSPHVARFIDLLNADVKEPALVRA
jgi:DNA-binding transcriptional LysR family regulator